MNKNKMPVLVIIGSTASGKSDLAVEAAKKFNGEIISADSRQIYKHLNLATGKITKEEMKGIPHHLISIVDPEEKYNVHKFTEQAIKIIDDIQNKGKLPIIVGGTGFYIENLLFNGVTSLVPSDPDYRKELSKKDIKELQYLLKKNDKDAYLRIDLKNPRRLIRALEVIRALGIFPMQERIKRYNYTMVGIQQSRVKIKEKIYIRLEKRFDGIIKEIKKLLDRGVSSIWLDNLGLEARHITRMLKQDISKEETKKNLLSAIFAYSKRQDTWWKKYPETRWYYKSEFKKLFFELNKIYK